MKNLLSLLYVSVRCLYANSLLSEMSSRQFKLALNNVVTELSKNEMYISSQYMSSPFLYWLNLFSLMKRCPLKWWDGFLNCLIFLKYILAQLSCFRSEDGMVICDHVSQIQSCLSLIGGIFLGMCMFIRWTNVIDSIR